MTVKLLGALFFVIMQSGLLFVYHGGSNILLRFDDINEISDGKLYSENDMVFADTLGCRGCSRCCESNMGDTIVLDPYDIFNLTKGTGKSFDELLTLFQIELGVKDTVILPHIKMENGCGFLDENKRCSIHKFRPSICRLFPLGRIYNDKGFDFFLQTGECAMEDRKEIRVSEWIGIDNLSQHSDFIMKWHRFIKFEQKKVAEIKERAANEADRIETISDTDLETYASIIKEEELLDSLGISGYRKDKAERLRSEADENVKEVMKTVLRFLYMDGYDHEEDFFQQFDVRLKRVIGVIRHIN